MPPHPRKSRVRPRPKKRLNLWIKFFLFMSAFIFIVSFLSGIFYLTLLYQLPNIKTLNDYNPLLATRIFSADGIEIGNLFKEKRFLVSLSELP
ncbi:MAG: hypothetical protein MUQ20_05085, partial [Deltaproteobacteria bacterium]|nr:hypothetical protein [Deltaproteobacteria bacterium]